MWTMNIPQESGYFWFYGDPFGSKRDKLYFVEVWRISNGFAYITEGNFMDYKEGYWMPCELPELPVQESEDE